MITIIKDRGAFRDVSGIVRIRKLPREWSHEKIMEIWPDLEERERDKYTQYEFKNVITFAGLNACNAFLGSYDTISGFALWLALGNGALNDVAQSDTQLVHELYRVQPSSTTIVGNITTVTTILNQSAQVGTFTEMALFGTGATSTLNSGQMNTHLLSVFSHNTVDQLAVDYSLTRN